jgi:protein ImuB
MFYITLMRVACVHIPNFSIHMEVQPNGTPGRGPAVTGGEWEERAISSECRRIWADILSTLARITMHIESQEPGTAFLDITRLPAVFRDEGTIASAIVQSIYYEFQLEAVVGTGNSRFVSFEACLFSSRSVCVIHEGHEKAFLSPLSVARLPVSDETKERLKLLGLYTLGQVSALPLPALISQFGTMGRIMWEMVNGAEKGHRIAPAFPVESIEEKLLCDGTIDVEEQVREALESLLERLCRELEETGKACRVIRLVLELQNKTFSEHHFVFHEATVRKNEIMRRIMNGLGTIQLESPIKAMVVSASDLSVYTGKQEGLFMARRCFSRGFTDIRGFLRAKYGCMPVGLVVENSVNTLLPDQRFIFVEL